MLPMVALKVCDTGAMPDLEEIIKKANDVAERRRIAREAEEDEAREREAREREAREREAREREAREREAREREAREREAREAAALAAQLELRRAEEALKTPSAEEALKTPSETDETISSSDESDVISLDPDDNDRDAPDVLNALYEKFEEEDALGAQGSLPIDQLDSIYMHMEKALAEINSAMKTMKDNDKHTVLAGIAIRLKADIMMLSVLRKQIVDSKDPLHRQLKKDVQRVDLLVREATAEQQADGTDDQGGSPNATESRWNSVLSLLGMLLFLLSAYTFPGMSIPYTMLDEELPIVYPYYNLTNEPETLLPEAPFVIIPNTTPTPTPTDLKTFRSRFHMATISALSTASSRQDARL
jgi:hypothetical protein